MDDYQKFIALSRYSRWDERKQRRETWEEVVNRYINYIRIDIRPISFYDKDGPFESEYPDEVSQKIEEARLAIQNLEVMPSMRALMTAGPALERCNVAGYNCAYLPVDDPRAFDETMYILMCGAGVGFSVERKNVDKLPVINEHFEASSTVIKVQDSKAGWARAFRELIALLYAGQIPSWDTSLVRPAGARLKVFGGRASGPEPLHSLFDFTVSTFTRAAGRRLKPIECHDILCKTGEVVVVGGVRRSALISLSDLDDYEMAKAKTGSWWEQHPHRALANNSAVYTGTPDPGRFMKEWTNIYESKSGERGIFNREAITRQVMRNGRREWEGIDFGTNPCSEIILRPYQFCNLTEVVVRPDDDLDSLKRKADIATFLGTVQACWTDFKYLRKIWKRNCEEERLLGVSLTGYYDNPDIVEHLPELRRYVVERNKYYADIFGINQATATTCVKPSGTVSQLVNSASGLHPRHSRYYVRTVRGDNKDPLTQFLKDQGVEYEPCVMKPKDTTVFSFYIKSPEFAVTRDDLEAEDHFVEWQIVQDLWCEHKPSVTINVREEEWPYLGGLVYRGFDTVTGVAFLPYSEHSYKQAPYQEITEDEWLAAPVYTIDWEKLSAYEKTDTTTGSQELACAGGYCEIVDIS